MYQPNFKKRKNNIPVLSKWEIDEIAGGYLLDFSPDAVVNPQPVNVELFLESYLDLILDYQYLSNDGRYLGMTVFNNTNRIPVFIPDENCADYYSATAGTVVIDTTLTADNQLNRCRYTCGHECGHWVFHRGHYNYDPNQLALFEMEQPFVQCRKVSHADFSGNTMTWDDARWLEWQADKFASCFLMPNTAVRNFFDGWELKEKNTLNTIATISKIFQVSEEAARYRLMDLGYIKLETDNAQLSLF